MSAACAAFEVQSSAYPLSTRKLDAKAAVSGDDAGGVNTEAAQLPNAGIRDIAASSMQAPYPSPRRKRQISSSPLHLLFRPNPLRWASVEFCAARRRNVYYVEGGANQLPSRVIYDRAWSAIAMAKPGDIDWDKAFEGVEWFHITGITPAISESAMALSLESVQEAKSAALPFPAT